MQKAVEEFKLQTRDLGLREGSHRRTGGGNTWHGRIFENFRNDYLDAVPHEIRQRGGRGSTLRRHQFGFNVAGPVMIPRLYRGRHATYFSLSYEGLRESISRSSLRTVPTLLERGGDFSQTVDSAGKLLPIYDPSSTSPNPAFDPSLPVSVENLQFSRVPFPENRIPESLLEPVAQRALRFYPNPNAAVGPFFQNNFFIHSVELNAANGMIAKVDHTLGTRHRLTTGLSFSNGLQGAARWFPNAANPGPPDRWINSRRGSLEHAFTISPKTVNTATFEASTNRSHTGEGDKTDYVSALGLSSPVSGRFPVFYMGRYLGMGQSSPASHNASNTFVGTDNFSTRRGKHSLKAYAQIVRYQVNSYSPAFPSGMFEFSSGPTSLPGIINTGHEFATFLLGLVDYSQIGLAASPSYFRRSTGRVSLSDSYQATKGLTFSVAFNLAGATPRIEKYDRQSNIDLNAMNPHSGNRGAMIVAGRGGPRGFQPVRFWAEPSASMAWTPGGKASTTFRASYSRSYSAPPMYSGQWGTQAFNGSATFFSQNSQLQPAFQLSAGVPPLPSTFPNLRGDAVNDQVAQIFEPRGRLEMDQYFGFSVQRELPGSAVLTLGFSDSGGRNLFVGEWNGANLNAIPLGALQYRDALYDESFRRSLSPYPQFLGFSVNGAWPSGRYHRDATSVRLEKRASAGMVVSADYSYSKQMDDYSGPGVQDVYNSRNEWSLTSWNSPHRASLMWSYELPIGSNKSLLNFADWRRSLVDGWSLSLVSSLYSGHPLALRPEFNNTGGVVPALRVNVVPGVDPEVPNPGPEQWFNPAAFEQPADFTTGNASRTDPTLRGPISQNHDLSLTKRFALAADRSMEFSAVGLNFLNHANWNDPDVVIGPESAPNVNAGKIIGSWGGRVIQLGLTFSF